MARRRARSSATAALAIAAAMVAAHVGTGCLRDPTLEELFEEPLVVTKRDPAADFAVPSTFAMTDEVPLFDSAALIDGGGATRSVDPAVADPTLAEIAAQLTARGYRQVAPAEGPDLGVAVTAVNRISNQNIIYGDWWGSGGSQTGFWGYAGATLDTPFTYSTVAWSSGTLLIELYDLRAARDEARRTGVTPTVAAPTTTAPITVLWVAILHGVIGEAGASLEAPPIELIRQAFAQSEYLVRRSE